MKITRKVKDILKNLPPECPHCNNKPGSPTLCDLCLGLRDLRSALGIDHTNDAYTGHYEGGRWRPDRRSNEA